jgi:excisionase family DNA binding protein
LAAEQSRANRLVNGGVDRAHAYGLTSLGDQLEDVMRNQVVDGTNPVAIAVPGGAAAVERQDPESAAIESSPAAAVEILTYKEAAQLLKISARTLERWTREGLIPYIRLSQRGRWSSVRFSRHQCNDGCGDER